MTLVHIFCAAGFHKWEDEPSQVDRPRGFPGLCTSWRYTHQLASRACLQENCGSRRDVYRTWSRDGDGPWRGVSARMKARIQGMPYMDQGIGCLSQRPAGAASRGLGLQSHHH